MFILERFCDFLDTANDSGLVFGDYEKDEITRAVLDFRLWTLDFRLRTLPLSAFQFSAFQLFPLRPVVSSSLFPVFRVSSLPEESLCALCG